MTAPEEQSNGQVVTFYSYKGGTGRTMALANVAWILAANGLRVLTVDWDLESPGLHRYFHPFLRDKRLQETEGVIDMIRRFSDARIAEGPDGRDIAEHVDFHEYTVSLEWDFGTGCLDFIGAGKQGLQYSAIVSTFDWGSFWDRFDGGAFFDELRRQFRDHYDFVLIDSRTGLSDSAGICTVQLPDSVVICFTLNTQSIEGSVAVARSIVKQREQRNVSKTRILPVPTRIENAEHRRRELGRAFAHRSFAPFLAPGPADTRPADGQEEYWGAVEVPYQTYYAYEEILATFGDHRNMENSLLASYVRLAQKISERPVTAPVIDEAVRQRWVGLFERSDPIEPSRILINYVPLDRVYAEWVSEQLAREGHTPVMHFAGAEPPDLDAFDRAVLILSRDYESFAENEQLAQALLRRQTTAGVDFAAGVLTGTVSTPTELTGYPYVDFTRMSGERAMEELLSALHIQPDTTARGLHDRSADGIRYPRVQAKFWNVQLVRNQSFYGRHRMIEELRNRILTSDTAEGGRVVLEGINGVGKTQIALEYTYRFAAAYDVVWWISAEQTDRVRTSLAELAERLGVPGDAEERVSTVREMLRQGKPSPRWLIVLDNADSPEELHGFLPTGAGHVIITSRNPHWTEKYHVQRLDVDVFARGESTDLLRRRVPRLTDEEAGRIADQSGDLPLALEQAAAWLALTGSSTDDYLDELGKRTALILEGQAPPDQLSLTASVRLSLERLREESPAAARLLQLFAFLAPEAIPFRLLQGERLSEYLAEAEPNMHDPLIQRTLISVLGRYALARVNTATGGAVVHRLTQGIIRDGLEPGERVKIREELWRVLASVKRGEYENRNNWRVYEELRAHLEASGAAESPLPEVRLLFLHLAKNLRYRGDFIGAEDLIVRVQKHWFDMLGKDDTLSLRLKSERGNVARERGHVKRAFEIDNDVVKSMTELLGANHPYTLIAVRGQASSLRAIGEFAQARELDLENVPRMQEVFGASNEDTLRQRNNLAVSLRLNGDIAQGLAEATAVLDSGVRRLDPNDYRIALYQDNYCGHLRAAGRHREARERLMEVLDRQRRVAEDAIITWRLAVNLAGVLRLVGENARGHQVAEEAYERLTALAGPQHPDTIGAELEMAVALWQLGRVRDGRRHAVRVNDFYRERRGPRHPFTLTTAADLAMIERADGDLPGARARAEDAATGLKATLGPSHPHTLAAQMSVATGRLRIGLIEEAYALDVEVQRRLTEQLGDRHPTTLAADVNLALSSRERRDGPQARSELPRVQERVAEILGADHPYAKAARDVRRIDVDIELQPT